MSIDCRTRRPCDRQALSCVEVFDRLIPEAIERNAELAARGLLYKDVRFMKPATSPQLRGSWILSSPAHPSLSGTAKKSFNLSV